MKAVFRTDASTKIGSGHVARCLTLASKLHASGYEIHFICREFNGHMAATVAAQYFRVHLLPGTGAASYPLRGRPAHASWLGVAWQEDAAQSADVLKQFVNACGHEAFSLGVEADYRIQRRGDMAR
jgi:hypothetical protein